MKLSDRSGTIAQSEIRSMTRACNALGGINMAQGVCDLEVPSIIIDAAKRAMDEGINIYILLRKDYLYYVKRLLRR